MMDCLFLNVFTFRSQEARAVELNEFECALDLIRVTMMYGDLMGSRVGRAQDIIKGSFLRLRCGYSSTGMTWNTQRPNVLSVRTCFLQPSSPEQPAQRLSSYPGECGPSGPLPFYRGQNVFIMRLH